MFNIFHQSIIPVILCNKFLKIFVDVILNANKFLKLLIVFITIIMRINRLLMR